MKRVLFLCILLVGCGRPADTGYRFQYVEDEQRKCWRIGDEIAEYRAWNCEEKPSK